MQIDLFDAARLADEGLQRAVDKAERSQPGWQDETYRIFKEDFLPYWSGPFLIEDFRSFLALLNTDEFPDASSRAFGYLPRRAIKDGLIQRIGVAQTTNKKAHKCFASQYVKC